MRTEQCDAVARVSVCSLQWLSTTDSLVCRCVRNVCIKLWMLPELQVWRSRVLQMWRYGIRSSSVRHYVVVNSWRSWWFQLFSVLADSTWCHWQQVGSVRLRRLAPGADDIWQERQLDCATCCRRFSTTSALFRIAWFQSECQWKYVL